MHTQGLTTHNNNNDDDADKSQTNQVFFSFVWMPYLDSIDGHDDNTKSRSSGTGTARFYSNVEIFGLIETVEKC